MTSPLISGRLVDRMSPGLLCVVGLVLLAIGLGAIAIFQITPPVTVAKSGCSPEQTSLRSARCRSALKLSASGARG